MICNSDRNLNLPSTQLQFFQGGKWVPAVTTSSVRRARKCGGNNPFGVFLGWEIDRFGLSHKEGVWGTLQLRIFSPPSASNSTNVSEIPPSVYFSMDIFVDINWLWLITKQFGAATPSAPTSIASTTDQTLAETTGNSGAPTYTDYFGRNGEGTPIARNSTVRITCKLVGKPALDGNVWWYRIAQNPWNNEYYASADNFYNNGQAIGPAYGTPFVDVYVPTCGTKPKREISTPLQQILPFSTYGNINIEIGSHGSISSQPNSTDKTNPSRTFIFNPDAGYTINDVSIDGVSIGSLVSYTFYLPREDHSLAVSFAVLPETPSLNSVTDVNRSSSLNKDKDHEHCVPPRICSH
jgi:hypothetical protein